MNSILFTIIKNDNQWLDEWVRYHLAIGFSHILIYDNNDGLNDYPMSDYIIEQCTLKNITIVNKRNLQLDNNKEFSELSIDCDYSMMLAPNEFLTIKNNFENINLFLNDKTDSLYVKVVPYDVIDEKEIVNLKKCKSYSDKYFKRSNNEHAVKSTELLIKKILTIK